jgi:phage terminase large subunit GpA-like protein
VFAIKGSSQADAPLTKPPSKVNIVVNGVVVAKTWLYTIGVNAAKADLLKGALRVVEPGPKYCHFPRNPDAGYDFNYFSGLLSEVEETKTERGRTRTIWKKLPGHERNEPLDIRNYAYAALNALDPDMEAVERRLKQGQGNEAPKEQPKRRGVVKRSADIMGGDW